MLLSEISNPRELQCARWVQSQLSGPITAWKKLACDASFRLYFRAVISDHSYVVMDAPPEKEASLHPYIAIDRALEKKGLCVPHIFSENIEQGFLLLSDLGDDLFSVHLNAATVDDLYRKALDDVLHMQGITKIEDYVLPPFDAARYRMEFSMIEEWYVERHLKRSLTAAEKKVLENAFKLLIENTQEQPQVFVHRDYHSRNLLLSKRDISQFRDSIHCHREKYKIFDGHQIGILDFQDAVWGPVTYDLMSLVRDCYIDWPVYQVEQWIENFRLKLASRNPNLFSDPALFLKWCDWMGLQRHLKCIGLFARLYYRDQKSGYMQYWPRLFQYVEQVCSKYAALSDLGRLMQVFAQFNGEGTRSVSEG